LNVVGQQLEGITETIFQKPSTVGRERKAIEVPERRQMEMKRFDLWSFRDFFGWFNAYPPFMTLFRSYIRLTTDRPKPQRGDVTIAEGERSEALGAVGLHIPSRVSGEGGE
jgi:hypothetical protein